MAKFVTFIADPELESMVIKAIAAINGELTIRGVSIEQVREAEAAKDITLVCTRQIDFAYKRVIVDKSMSTEDISDLLQPSDEPQRFSFDPLHLSLDRYRQQRHTHHLLRCGQER